MRRFDAAMALLFAFAALVQLNDPDPVRWIAIYGAACVLSALAALRRRVPSVWFAAVAVVAAAWALAIAATGPGAAEYRRMFDAWEMASAGIEEAREASGLVIVAAWMGVLFVRSRRPLAG